MMDKGICNKLEISVILALGIITLVVSSFIGVAGASPAGAGSGSGGSAAIGAALGAGMTFFEQKVEISAYANVGEAGIVAYTNEEYGFSIEYPGDWKVYEDFMGFAVMLLELESRINVIMGIEELPTRMTVEEYAKTAHEFLPEGEEIVKTFNDTINGEPVSGFITTSTTEGGVEIKRMITCFVRNTTAYFIVFTVSLNSYDEAEEDYFDPMLRSFNFIEKEAGIEIRVFIVTPSEVEAGEEVKIKFEVVNEADVEKTKTFLLYVDPPGSLLPEAIDFKTVTLAPSESVEIEFTFVPKEAGEHILYVEGGFWSIAVDHEEGARISVKTPHDVLEGENFTVTVTMDNVSDLAILLFKLNYDPSVITLNKIEKGSGIATSSWSHWYSSQDTGIVTVYAFSDPSGAPLNGPAELAKLEFSVVGMAGDKSALDIQGIITNSDMESLEAIWVDSEVTVIPGA